MTPASPPQDAMSGGPASSPMTTPQPQEGLEKSARVEVQMAVKVLQRTMAKFPIESEQFKAVHKAIGALAAGFGKNEDADRELMPAEILQLLGQVGPGTQSPGAQAMAGKPTPGAGAPAIPA